MENAPGDQPGSSPTTAAHSPDWHKRFHWKKGAMIETLFDGDWWESIIVDLDSERGALLHYVGGGEEEDEWIPLTSSRLRPPQSEAEPAEPSGLRADVVEPPTRPGDGRSAASRESSAADESGVQRPMRRSRMLSDDARLALQLQEEELKAARGMQSFARKRSKSSPRAEPPPKRKADPAPARAAPPPPNRKIASPRSDPAQSSSSRAPAAKSGASGKAAAARNLGRKEPLYGGSGASAEGTVSVQLAPDETVAKTAPRLKRNRIELREEETVMAIKRRVREEVFPSVEASQIEIRTPSNILCGQDHSLKYVRTFLWPAHKGELTLLYSKAKDSFL